MSAALHRIDCRKLAENRALFAGILKEVSVPEELARLDADTYTAWGNGISVAHYLQRERVLRATAFSRRGLWTWVLKDAEAVLASCESYEVEVVAAGRRGSGYGIASVYVEPQRRGHGHASELLRRVHAELKSAGALLAYLVSEVGPKLYGRLGYVERPLYVRSYAAAAKDEYQAAPLPWELFAEEDVQTALAARRLPARPLAIAESAERLAEHVHWHLARSRYYGALKGQAPLRFVGARARFGDAMAIFAPDVCRESGVLRVLTLYPGEKLAAPGAGYDPRSTEGEALRSVLQAGRVMARDLGLSALEIWENPSNAGYLEGGVRKTDDRELPMVLGLSAGIRGEDWLDYERAHWL